MMSKKAADDKEPSIKTICKNRKAWHSYEILEKMEAGIVLTGTEVKSLRAGRAALDDAYARMEREEVYLLNVDIPEYAMGNRMNHEPKRKRKLLLHRREIAKFAKGTAERGLTIIPLRLYFKGGLVKVELAIGKGKRVHDKRETLKNKDAKRDIARAMRGRQK